jgi:hypothetical protein
MLQDNLAPAGHARFHKHQRAMGIDSQRFRLFFDVITLNILAANAHGHLHQHPLTAAARHWIQGCVLGLTHSDRSHSTIPGHIQLSSGLQTSVSKDVIANS